MVEPARRGEAMARRQGAWVAGIRDGLAGKLPVLRVHGGSREASRISTTPGKPLSHFRRKVREGSRTVKSGDHGNSWFRCVRSDDQLHRFALPITDPVADPHKRTGENSTQAPRRNKSINCSPTDTPRNY